MMEFTNTAYKWNAVPRAILDPFVLLLSPFAPHVAEELWAKLGHAETLAYEKWPEADEQFLVADTLNIAVQVNGKLRSTIQVAPEASKEAVLKAARTDENVQRHLDGSTIKKEVYVPGRIVNFVVAA